MKISFFFKDAKPLSQLLGLFLIFLACSLIAMPLALLPDLVKPAGEVGSARLQLVAEGLVQLVGFLLTAWLFAKLFFLNPRQALGFHAEGRHWALGLVGIVIIVLLIPVTDWLSTWNESWTFGALEESMRKTSTELTAKMLQLLAPATAGDLLLQLLVMAAIPALCEEILFRGALQPILQSLVRNSHVGILLAAVIFSLAHGDMYGFVPRLLLGLLLGYFFWTTGSIAVSACAHFANNAVVVVACHCYNNGALALNPFEPIGLPWTLTLGCTIGAILLFYLYFVKKPRQASGNPDSAPSETEG